jgi:hypothetical protein
MHGGITSPRSPPGSSCHRGEHRSRVIALFAEGCDISVMAQDGITSGPCQGRAKGSHDAGMLQATGPATGTPSRSTSRRYLAHTAAWASSATNLARPEVSKVKAGKHDNRSRSASRRTGAITPHRAVGRRCHIRSVPAEGHRGEAQISLRRCPDVLTCRGDPDPQGPEAFQKINGVFARAEHDLWRARCGYTRAQSSQRGERAPTL